MTFKEAVIQIINKNGGSLTPQEIRSIIKSKYPQFYKTESHLRNVQKGHYKDEEHALLAQIYSLVRNDKYFESNENVKPMIISLAKDEIKTISDKYLHALKVIGDWAIVSDWAKKVADIYPDILEKAERDAVNQKSDTTGLREIAARISANISEGVYEGKIEMDDSERPKKYRFINHLTREHVLAALKEIDDNGIAPDERSSTYDLIHNAKRYPSKLVFSLAHKYLNGKIRGRDTFSGGEDTECFNTLRKLGFIIERKDFVIELLKKFIRQGEEAEDLTTRSYPSKFCDLDMKVGFGQGNFARVPWISFIGYSQTV